MRFSTHGLVSSVRRAAVAALACGFVLTSAAAPTAQSGEKAFAKFPAKVRGMGLWEAKSVQLSQGVEYCFGRFSRLYTRGKDGVIQYGSNDLHVIRIDYKKAPVLMKTVESSPNHLRTSAAARKVKALFGINGTFPCSKKPRGPQFFTKADGKVVKGGDTGESGSGIAFKTTSKDYRFGQGFNEKNAAEWDSVITTEAYGLSKGAITLSPVGNWGIAPYTFVGEAPGNVVYLFVVDGRRKGSLGMSYGTCCQLMADYGCTEGMVFDGGGSTTMVVRKDLLPAGVAYTQHLDADKGDYWILNRPSDGSERAVINQFLFVSK